MSIARNSTTGAFFKVDAPRSAVLGSSRWCYLFGNLSTFASIPQNASGFESVFKVAETGEMNDTQLKEYLGAMVTEYDKLVIGEYNREEGRKEGREEGRKEGQRDIVKVLLDSGMSIEEIAQRLKTSVEELEALLSSV